MKSIHSQRFRRRARSLAAVIVLVAVCLLVAYAFVGCIWLKRTPTWQRPLTYDGVPIIRVLITPRSLDRVTIATSGGYILRVDDQIITTSDKSMSETSITRKGQAWQFNSLTLWGRQIALESTSIGHVRIGDKKYRGSIQLIGVEGENFLIVNYLDMESYLAGVLPKELYAHWSPEAYRALAVAGRTFAMYHMMTFGETHSFDLGSTQAAQVYGGLSAETKKSWQAVRSTHGQTLAHGPWGDEKIFMAQYSACCGGVVNGAGVIRDARNIEPLQGGQICNDCKSSSRYRWEPVRITKAEMHRALISQYTAAAKLRRVAQLRVIERNSSGRIVWVDVVDDKNASIRLRAEDIRLSLLRASVPAARKLYSMNCQMRDVGDAIEFHDGRGFGHGVGLCQWGAQGKAERGIPAEAILNSYYPGAKLVRAY